MKKVIAILAVLMLVAGAVFAAATIKIQSKVGSTVDPAFILRASLTGEDSYNTAVAGEGQEDVISASVLNRSIKETEIKVFFQIAQSIKGGSDGKIVKLGVSATKMIQVNNDGSAKENAYESSEGTIAEKTTNNGVGVSVELNNEGQFVASYTGKADANTLLGQFTVTWAQDENAEDGLYQAAVSLSIIPE